MRQKLLLIVLAAVAFGASFAGTFQFDDFALLSDPAVTSASGWWESWRLEQTRPLTWVSFWANYQLGGAAPWGYHAVNLFLHVAVVLLLFNLLRTLLPEPTALLAAAIFAVHPIAAEPVNYIFARSTLLAALFSILAAREWLRDRRWMAVALFAVAMLAKEECVALPLALVLLDWWRDRKWHPGPIAAMLAIALALGIRVVWAASVVAGSQAGAQAGISPVNYFAAQGVVLWRYINLLLFPWGFSVDYPVRMPPLWLAAAGWAGIAMLVAAGVRYFHAAVWFLIGLILLLPSSSILPAADIQADRRLYLPMLAWSVGFGWILSKIDRRIAALLVLALAGVSIRTSLIWSTPESLWTEAMRHAPGKVRPRLQLSRVVPPDRALHLLDEAEVLAPNDPDVATEQGRVLLTLGKPDEALAAFGRALAISPEDPRAISNRGVALASLGQPDAARNDFERALQRDPCLFDARVNLKRLGFAANPPPANCRYTPQQQAALGN